VVGAWIDPDVPVLSPQHRVEEALQYLRQTRNVSHVFLESTENGQFAGAVSLSELLGSDRSATLGQLRIDAVTPVSNRAALASVAFHAAWDDYLFLPVVGRRNNVLGGISRATLRRGARNERAAASLDPGNIVGQLVFALLLTITGLARVLVQPDGAAGRLRSAGRRR
jgi:predicted transcriptional regulator